MRQNQFPIMPIKLGIVLFLALCAISLFFRKFFFIKGFAKHGFDQSIYKVVANQLDKGSALYKDIWVSKPPFVYVINWLNLYLPFRLSEFILGLICVFALWYIARNLIRNPIVLLSMLISFAMIFYNYNLYGYGGNSEEYGAIFLVISVLFHIKFLETKRPTLVIFAGIFGVLAVLSKEPFLVSSIPWIVALLFKKKYKSLFYYTLGVFIALLPFALYLAAINGYLDFYRYLVYSFQYADFTGLGLLEKLQIGLAKYFAIFSDFGIAFPLLPLLGIAGFWSRKKLLRKVVIIFYTQFILEFIVISLTGNAFGHYFLQIVFSFCILSFIGVQALFDSIIYIKPKLGYIVMPFLIILIGYNFNHLNTDGPRLKISAPEQVIKETILKHVPDGSTIFVDDPYLSYLYFEQDLSTSSYIPVPVFHFFMVPDFFCDDRVQKFISSSTEHPNDYIVTSSIRGMTDLYPELLLMKNNEYDLIYSGGTSLKSIKIWELKD
ncbi:MAG: hypothetical protein ACI9UJ_002311 [bacterium]|jgi:hypothetical protein